MKTIKNLKAEEIRKSILQLAIQGKLVKQDSNDEPASELVKRIYAEKQKLIQEGKIKKDMNESFIFKGDDNCYYEKIGNSEPVKLEDLPFNIPENWTWIKFPNLVNFVLGKTPERHNPKYWNDGKYPWFSIADMKDKKTVYETKEKVSECSLIENFNSSLSLAGTLIMSFKLTVGRVSILGVDAVHNEAIISIFPYLNANNSIRDWLFYTLGLIVEYVDQTDAIKGSTLNKEKISSMLIPLPPLNEQNRIISKLLIAEPLIADYDKLENKLSILEAEFPEKLKKSILQYAIEGKLVKQDPNDEPASVLLERIKAEKEKLIKEGKIKRDKNESYIYQGDDKNYYENLPQGWCICTLNNLATYKKGPFGSSLTKGMFVSESTPNRVKVYEQKNAIQHDEKIGSYFISENKFKEMQSFEVNPLDFIVSCAGTIGEIFKLPLNASKGIINQALMKVTLINESISDYFEIIFYDALHKLSEKSKGTAIKNIAPFEILKPALIQLPPLDEQQRILEKLNIIATLIDC